MGASAAGTRTQPPPAPLLRHRKNVELLQPEQLAALRRGFARLVEISENAVGDNRGYQHLAGIHGLPDQLCRHGGDVPGSDPLFLPWHRAYLYVFERALRRAVPDAVLAWWDWTSLASHVDGIPAAFADAGPGGQVNPLAKAPVQPAARVDGRPVETFRRPGSPARLPSPDQIRGVLAARSFLDFGAQLEDVHNKIHGWVGGTMGVVPWSAYDPIFWAHHTNIDRLWRVWQLRHPQNFPASFLNQALPPFPLTVAQTLNIKTLGYDYASTTTHVPGTNA
jgi:tyrosinase